MIWGYRLGEGYQGDMSPRGAVAPLWNLWGGLRGKLADVFRQGDLPSRALWRSLSVTMMRRNRLKDQAENLI